MKLRCCGTPFDSAKESQILLKRNVDLDRARHLSGYDRVRVCVPSVCACGRRNCRYRRYIARCSSDRFLFQICNHNLLLADAIHRASKRPPILPDCCVLILDESHKLPEVARQMFGTSLCAGDIRTILREMRREGFIPIAEFFTSATSKLLKLLDSPKQRELPEYLSELVLPYQLLAQFQQQKRAVMSKALYRNVIDALAAMGTLLNYRNLTDTVCYAEENEAGGTTLWATVYHLDSELKRTLWWQRRGMILTSGTMAVQEDFSRFREETGLVSNGRVVESVARSPFDYEENCLLYLPEHPPQFRGADPTQYRAALTAEIAALLDAAYGHALVLFTSYDLMEAVADRLKEEQLIFPVFTIRKNDSHTLKKFRNHPGAVLLATGSAWEGMDFPGDQVSLLIIPKLPFSAPDELRKRQQKEYDTLQDFIRAIVVPEMQIKLRQGFGRAIRTETDTCVVAILDERSIPGGRYHEAMLEALPEIPITTNIVEVAEFYLDRKPDRYFKEVGNCECTE